MSLIRSAWKATIFTVTAAAAVMTVVGLVIGGEAAPATIAFGVICLLSGALAWQASRRVNQVNQIREPKPEPRQLAAAMPAPVKPPQVETPKIKPKPTVAQPVATASPDTLPATRNDILIDYQGAHDDAPVSRKVTVQRLLVEDGTPFALEGYCHLRRAYRTFLLDRIKTAADPETGEVITDPAVPFLHLATTNRQNEEPPTPAAIKTKVIKSPSPAATFTETVQGLAALAIVCFVIWFVWGIDDDKAVELGQHVEVTDPPKQAASKTPIAEPKTVTRDVTAPPSVGPEIKAPRRALPPAQVAFDQIAADISKRVATAQTDFARGALRPERAKALCAAQRNPKVVGWIGTVDKISTNGDGFGVVEIVTDAGTRFKTTNNDFSDLTFPSLVRPNMPLYAKLGSLTRGEPVAFSGLLFPSETDCFTETSLTLTGSLSKPEFLMRFTDIEPIAAK